MNTQRLIASFLAIAAILSLLLFAQSTYRSAETPPWRKNPSQPPTTPEKTPQVATNSEEFTPFNLVTYNVKNWLVSTQTSEKTAESKAAVIKMITAGEPDILGLSEIGDKADIEEIQKALKKEGFELPHTYYTGGVDKIRHLAILSRFPITSFEKIDPTITGTPYFLQRGILDATIRIGKKDIRLIGLHLKSKRITTDFDQEILRLEEAKFVRKHIDSILKENPATLLIAYGDWNDNIRSLSTRAILGTYRTPDYMTAMHIADSRGEKWTHNWTHQDSYTRIDFVTVSKAIKTYVNKKKSYIIDHPYWNQASDHRPILIRFEP